MAGRDPNAAGASRWAFLGAFLRARRTVGAVAPTSRGVARRIARLAGVEGGRLVAELGPGTGAITRELLAALPADGRLWAFEVYPPFVEHLRTTIDDPRFTVVAESAEALAGLREREGLPGFDAVVSAVPFSLMDPAQTTRILHAAAGALRPGGVFVALQYHPRYLAPLLRAEFAAVAREVYPWNVPPALLLRASGPRPRTAPVPLNASRLRALAEGRAILALLVALGLAAGRVFRPAAPLAFAAAGATALTFRDPPRAVVRRPELALAPADGRVIHVGRVWDDHWQVELLEVAIFLALWDVHVQRSPLDGEVVAQRRRPGGYRAAMSRAATHGNNRLETHLQTAAGPCVVTQISGLIARRIIPWAALGTGLAQGERLGMIAFGSQVTLRLPTTAVPLVAAGDRVRAGLTPVARLAENADPAPSPSSG